MSHLEPALPSFIEAELNYLRDTGVRPVNYTSRLVRRPPASLLGEWLLASAFRGLCQMMRAAAQFCGILVGDEASNVEGIPEAARVPELQALCLSGLPLCEIAAAEREWIWRIEAARADAPLRYDSPAATHRHVLH
jgi:hypothetical protein